MNEPINPSTSENIEAADVEITSVSTTETPAVVVMEPQYASIDDFAKIEIKIGKVLSAEPVEGSEKLLKLSVDFDEKKPRQVLSGIAKHVSVDELIGNTFPFVTNLAPRKMMGMDSQAMILAVNDDVQLALLKPSKEIKLGSRIQ